MTDYEDGMRLGIRRRWPNVRVRGCLFHFKQAINRKTKKLGMKRFLDKNINAREVKAMLANIPLLPSTQIVTGFSAVKIYATEKNVDKNFAKLFTYFGNYWLQQVR